MQENELNQDSIQGAPDPSQKPDTYGLMLMAGDNLQGGSSMQEDSGDKKRSSKKHLGAHINQQNNALKQGQYL